MPLTKPLRAQALPRLKARRMEICLTAAHTFVERGFDATSVNDIAAALDITKAGLYHYISSKESLLFDIITLGLDSIDEEVIEPARAIADPEARFLDIVLRHALLATCSDGVITLLIDEVHALPPLQRKTINLRRRKYFEHVREVLLELEAAGRLQDIDPTVHYIRSKDALLFEIVTLGMDWLDEDVVKVVRTIPDADTRLRETINRHARLTACNEPWITALLDEMHGLPTADRRKI
jgi:AcrR family transcriptional regulator